MANNFQHLNDKLEAMGRKSPYKELGAKFANDLEGYYSNLLAGHTATGRGYAQGTEDHPNTADREHVPYKLTRKEADFIGAVINNTSAFAGHDDAKKIRELARANGTLITEKGETNRLLHDIEQADPGWSGRGTTGKGRVLEPSIKTFKTGLVHEIHPTEQHLPETIRPGKGYQQLTKALARTSAQGRPDIAIGASLHHTFQDNKAINAIERDFSDHKIDEAAAREKLHALGEDPDDYRFVGGSGGLVTPYEDDPEALTPEEHSQMKDNLRQKWVSGGMNVEDYRKKSAEVPLPSRPSKPAPAPKPVQVPVSEPVEAPEAPPVPKPIAPKPPKPPKPVAPPTPQEATEPSKEPSEPAAPPKKAPAPDDQEFTSKSTSINKNQLPAIFSKVDWQPGTKNIDVGGGKFDNAETDYLKTKGVENAIHDKYNRSDEHNASVHKPDHYDTATISNVLNVIKEPHHRQAVLQRAHDNLKPGGKVHITTYGAPKSGPSGADSWQESRKLKDYHDEVKQVFPDAQIQNGMIVGTKAHSPAGEAAPAIAPAPDEPLPPVAKAKKVKADYPAAVSPPVTPGKPPKLVKPKVINPKTGEKEWDGVPEEEKQKYAEEKVRRTMANQIRDDVTHKLEVQRDEQGGVKYDPNGSPVYVQHDYDIANAPMLKKKALGQIKDADKHEDTLGNLIGPDGKEVIDPETGKPVLKHKYLNQTERRRLSAMHSASAVHTMGDKIFDSYNEAIKNPDVAAGEGWYSRMREKLAGALGEHHELFAQLLGATSAKTPVRTNFINALDAFEQYKEGLKDPTNMNAGFNKHIAKFLEAHGKLQEGEGALTQHMRDTGILKPKEADHKSDADAMAHWIRHHKILPHSKIGNKYSANSNAVLKSHLAGRRG